MTIQRLVARLASFTLLCVLFTQTAFSQTQTITGKVTDDKGTPIVGASVSVKGTTVGTSTRPDGSFTITAPASAKTLVVSSVGYGQQDIPIAGQTTFAVALIPS